MGWRTWLGQRKAFKKNSLWPIFPACWCREPEKKEVIFKIGGVLGCRKIFFGIGLQENIARRILHPAWTWTSGWEFQQIGSNQEVVRGSISKVRLDCKRQSDRGRNGDAPRQSSRQQSTCTNKNTIRDGGSTPHINCLHCMYTAYTVYITYTAHIAHTVA